MAESVTINEKRRSKLRLYVQTGAKLADRDDGDCGRPIMCGDQDGGDAEQPYTRDFHRHLERASAVALVAFVRLDDAFVFERLLDAIPDARVRIFHGNEEL